MPVVDVISDTRIPVKLWTPLTEKDSVVPLVEESAVRQLRNVANHPASHHHVAVMPDVHTGNGATIGTVMATKDAIIPSAVGVDIGCGMMAVKTPLDPDRVIANVDNILHSIRRSIPTGFHENRDVTPQVGKWQGWFDVHSARVFGDGSKGLDLHEKAMRQIGTLGGGNHFIEICLDKEHRNVWVMLHSGSRHIGLQIANRYIAIAKEFMRRFYIELPDPYLAFIPKDDPAFGQYWEDLQWAQWYAATNREEMMRKVLKDLAFAVNHGKEFDRQFEVNCHHNYASIEYHYGSNIYITRKGAIRARVGDYGIIPGSMGAKSFIVKGKGEPESFDSCSHGAGRKMSRSKAKKEFSVEDLKKQTEGIACSKEADIIDEIPAAYKSIDDVMSYQEDLVETIAELKQIMCLKGGKE